MGGPVRGSSNHQAQKNKPKKAASSIWKELPPKGKNCLQKGTSASNLQRRLLPLEAEISASTSMQVYIYIDDVLACDSYSKGGVLRLAAVVTCHMH